MNNPNQLLTSHEVGVLLQMDKSSVVKWVNDGLLPAFRTPGGHRRIRVGDLLQFLDKHGMFVPEELRGPKKRVLIVDDDEKLLKALSRSMKNYPSLDVRTVDNGVQALVQVGAWRPDVLVLDVQMPGMSGLDVCAELKKTTETQRMQILIVTGSVSETMEKQAKDLGASAVLPKPVTAKALAEFIGVSQTLERQ